MTENYPWRITLAMTLLHRHERTLYFAYGRNMHLTIMGERCPAADFGSLAVLRDHRIIINRRGVSSVEPEHGHEVHGVLWWLSESCEAALDIVEGVARGHYRKEAAYPHVDAGEVGPALIYRASDLSPGPPRPGYLEALEEAAVQHGFPGTYRAYLSSLRHI